MHWGVILHDQNAYYVIFSHIAPKYWIHGQNYIYLY